VAEEEKKEQEQGEEGENKPGKKKIIIIAVIALVAIAVAIGVTLFLMGGDESEADEASTEEVVEAKVPAIYLELTPAFLITLNDGARQRYMQVHVTVSSRDQAAIDAVEHHLPFIKSKVNTLYSSQDFAAIQTADGKSALREQSLAVINEVLEGEGETLIENVFFTNFVLQ